MTIKNYGFSPRSLMASVTAGAALAVAPLGLHAADPFTGFYVGGSVGMFSDVTGELTYRGSSWTDQITHGVQETLFTRLDIRAGYGHLLDNRVYLGAEASYTLWDNFDGTIWRSVDTTWGSETEEVTVGEGYALKAQLGYAVSQNVLLYATAGYQEREFELKYREVGPSGAFQVKDDDDFGGFGYGFGLRWAFTDQLMFTAEVFHVDYSSENFDTPWGRIKIDPTETQFDMGLMFRF